MARTDVVSGTESDPSQDPRAEGLEGKESLGKPVGNKFFSLSGWLTN